MLFKISFKNMKKSFKDYAIYFLTLVLGVAIFYMFNSLDSQQAMLDVTSSTREFIKIMVRMLELVSVFVAVVLGLLIVYANNFLINRRKKEFGIYMTLGMSKGQISRIILFETILVGILSLVAGIVIGVFASQFMSILVAKLFQADLSEFQFVFSKAACIKTCIYFALMYFAVMIFNTITISRYKLINLLTAIKKNEKLKLKNPVLSVIVFFVSIALLGWAYWTVTVKANTLNTAEKAFELIIVGIVGTLLFFWSLSGFIIKVIQSRKSIYLKGTNMFVLRQLNNKINTTVVSMSVICIMLFMTISILSASLSLRNTMEKDLVEMTPVDLNLYKTANLPKSYVNAYGNVITCTEKQIEDSKYPITYTLENYNYDLNKLKDIVEIPIYVTDELTWRDSLGSSFEEAKLEFPGLLYDSPEEIVKVSDYNKIARVYGLSEYSLEDDEFIVLCDFDSMKELRDRELKKSNATITLDGKIYHSKYNECQSGYIRMSTSHVNTGIILVPDSCNLKEEWKEQYFLAANYNTDSEDEYLKIEEDFTNNTSQIIKELKNDSIELDGMTKNAIVESSVGLATMVVFIAIYLGLVFLIASAAILALKQLTESADNKQRYTVLRKIGCDEKMINKALFAQIAIFFMLPLLLAIIHSIFGIQFALSLLSGLVSSEELIPSIIATVIIIGVIYGIYFLSTYFGSKNIIKEE